MKGSRTVNGISIVSIQTYALNLACDGDATTEILGL